MKITNFLVVTLFSFVVVVSAHAHDVTTAPKNGKLKSIEQVYIKKELAYELLIRAIGRLKEETFTNIQKELSALENNIAFHEVRGRPDKTELVILTRRKMKELEDAILEIPLGKYDTAEGIEGLVREISFISSRSAAIVKVLNLAGNAAKQTRKYVIENKEGKEILHNIKSEMSKMLSDINIIAEYYPSLLSRACE